MQLTRIYTLTAETKVSNCISTLDDLRALLPVIIDCLILEET